MYTPQEFSAPGFQGDQKPELRFVPSALFQGSSKFAHCTESGASVHTQRQMASDETCWPLKRFQAGYPSSLVAGVCAHRSWDRWRTPQLPRPNPVDSAASPPAQQRAATWLSSNRLQRSPSNKPLEEALAFCCSRTVRDQGALVKIGELKEPQVRIWNRLIFFV